MTIEQQLREQLDRVTDDVPTGPDLATSLERGRTGRRRRTVLVTAGGLVTGTAVAAMVLVTALGGPSDGTGTQVATDPTSSAPAAAAAGDFVSGTTMDELIASVVARHLPFLGEPDDVYPSDWDHAGPMPDADHADATDWQAVYTASEDEQLLVLAGYGRPGEAVDPGCTGGQREAYQPRCQHRELPGGGSITDESYLLDGGYVFYSSYVAASGFTVNATETVTARSWQQAAAQRAFTNKDLHPLITDARLTFPLPASRR